ncbi:hypothetical protein [Hymenobacter weizhouensis]|uniref:hypothetical protein n=1 Tax=Hymenobacter sp. YIM 151500-1 TaxID=2987689 RepID=UPI0022275520|nr:hypothetical protein [Hymenobacter sp. YIM 151500-1]UYZ63223.1 hypothetical protein OIS53_19805 [Hymenobacter sp. YIM 151500-1]
MDLLEKIERNRHYWEEPSKYVLVKTVDAASAQHEYQQYLIMEADDRRYVLINDNALAKAIIERMIMAGCTIYENMKTYDQAVPLKPKPTEFKPWW